MNDRTLTVVGLLGTALIAALVLLGVYGFVSGLLLDTSGPWFLPSVATLAVVAVVVAAMVVGGSHSKRWRENPYW